MPKPSQRILVATTNPGKVRELRGMLGDAVRWVALADFPDLAEVVEDGATFAANARKKATEYAKATGLWTLADDSGLVVDALGGAPGVKSARFSGDAPPGTDRKVIDKRNIAKLLELLRDVPPERRTARFVCHLCLATPQVAQPPSAGDKAANSPPPGAGVPHNVLIETEGRVEGRIIDEPAGTNGFGYDPVFFVPKLGKTVAQLPDDQKNAISHRGNAIRKLKPLLIDMLKHGSVEA
ncbi:MAG: non-canonical purine NTP pyrophosphatase [Sedimentisphaerales bacterium]|nr:non-canonical purine NTP pyrophosphatase [Sedimentisphaerales bacterium]